MRVWRICRAPFAQAAFSGEGPRLFSGRWNPKGVPMVYTSTHLSLAALEVFVHLEVRSEPDDLVSVMAELAVEQDVLLQQGEALLSRLPRDWRSLENRALREIGAAWIASASSLALMVPSAVIEGEWNVLLNPAHPDARKIALAEPKTFQFDPRMFRGRR